MKKIKIFIVILIALMFIASCSPNFEVEKMENKIVIIETNMGNIEIELDEKNAPATTENFLKYVNEGFYNGTIFHRVINNFMIQGGGFTADMKEKNTKAPIKLESNNGLKNNKYTIAMARTNDPDSATSQFFINVEDNAFLDYNKGNPGYAVFGKVISGKETVNKIKQAKTGNRGPFQDWPVQDVVIVKAYVKE